MRKGTTCGINPGFPGLSPTSRQVAHVLRTRLPLLHPRRDFIARLACLNHAASVHSEPGSNSPKETFERNSRSWLIRDFCGGWSGLHHRDNKGLSSRQSHRVIFKELVFPNWERRLIRQILPGPSRLLPKNFRKNPLGRSDCPAGRVCHPNPCTNSTGPQGRGLFPRRGSQDHSRPRGTVAGRWRLSANLSSPHRLLRAADRWRKRLLAQPFPPAGPIAGRFP